MEILFDTFYFRKTNSESKELFDYNLEENLIAKVPQSTDESLPI